jgi:regulator of sigma E protease
MIVFLVGVELMPAVVGKVRPNSPAAIAGIREKDRIVEINGETFVDFLSMATATMLSDNTKPLELKVKHPDGSIEDFSIFAEDSEGSLLPGRDIGIMQAETLKITESLSSGAVKVLYEATGLKPADKVVAFDGTNVQDAWQLDELIENSFKPSCVLTVERVDEQTNETSLVNLTLPLSLNRVNDNFKSGYDLAHIYSMIPRLKITFVRNVKKSQSFSESAASFWKHKILKQADPDEEAEPELRADDVIVQIGSTVSPTFDELTEVVTEHADKPLLVKVLRKNDIGVENAVDVVVTPRRRRGSERVEIGIGIALDAEHAVVASTIDIKNGPSALEIPKGATITAVDGKKVSSFYDVINIIKNNKGHRISIEFITADGKDAGGTGIAIPATHDYITTQPGFTDAIYFDYIEETFKADNAIEAVTMGVKKTKMFITDSYLTLKGLFSQKVKKEAVSGPVGIVTISYKIAATKSFTYFAYFMGLISSCLAFMNLLPIPVVDGGVIVLLIIEKIKGSPISLRAQEVISYAGLAFILTLFVWLTYNDILNLFRW